MPNYSKPNKQITYSLNENKNEVNKGYFTLQASIFNLNNSRSMQLYYANCSSYRQNATTRKKQKTHLNNLRLKLNLSYW